MKKVIMMLLMMILLVGCYGNKGELKKIPSKSNPNDNSVIASTVNTKNLDEYMFRDDVQYVDLRSSKMVLEEGYVAGFEFIPFYSIIASFSPNLTLYRMVTSYDDNGNRINAGQIGGFVPQFQESKSIIESLFSKDKYIFFISQGGSEGSYVINLLVQLGYNSSLLYNVGGVSNSEGLPSYRSIETNKYYVSGNNGFNPTVTYSFIDDLTPIE